MSSSQTLRARRPKPIGEGPHVEFGTPMDTSTASTGTPLPASTSADAPVLLPTTVSQASANVGTTSQVWHNSTPAVVAIHGYREKQTAENVHASTKQGTVMGVIFPCMANILGVLLFLRLPIIVGKAGILQTFILVLISCTTTFITALSLSAVSTNGKILGGGSYFLISRSLGPSVGTGVGLCFYCANSIGAALYILGTVEAWDVAWQELSGGEKDAQFISDVRMRARVYGYGILAFCLVFCSMGVKYVARLGTVFLFMVLTVILAMYLGLFIGPIGEHIIRPPVNVTEQSEKDLYRWRGFESQAFSGNWFAAYDAPQQALEGDDTVWSFFSCLSLWFPACTGIMAGSNRSADLKEPTKSIPFGTLFAQIFTSLIYLSFVFLYGAACTRTQLLGNSLIAAYTSWPHHYVVIFGVMASTVGAALASLTSASRLIDAISKDDTLPALSFLSGEPGKEPRKGLFFSCFLCFCAISVGELNFIAPILTMFFLMCYFCINMSCAMLDVLDDPNWRPTFRYHHVFVSFIGMALCLFLMFAINWWVALLAIFLCSLIFLYVTTHSQEINWGDGFQGMKFQLAKMLLRDCDKTEPHSKNWRPQILVLTGLTIDKDKEGLTLHDIELVHCASQLKAGRGLTIVGGVISVPDLGRGSFLSRLSTTQIQDWSQVVHDNMKELGIAGFARCVYAAKLGEGILSLIQTAGLGAFQPNCVMVSWPFSWVVVPEARVRFIQAVQVCSVFEKVILVAKEGHRFPLNGHKMKSGTIDIWWVIADGGIMLLLAFLLQKNEVWRGCNIRLFVVIDAQNDDPAEVKAELVNYVQDHRLPVSVRTVAMDSNVAFNQNRFSDMSRRMQTRQALYAMHGSKKEQNPFDNVFQSALRVHGAGFLQDSSQGLSDEYLRRNAFTDPGPAHKSRSRPVPDVLLRENSNASVDNDSPSARSSGRKADGSLRSSWVSSFAMDKNRLKSTVACSGEILNSAKVLNEAIVNQSANAQLVITNLPDVPENESAFGYMQFLEHLTAGLHRVLLVRGTASEVISAFT